MSVSAFWGSGHVGHAGDIFPAGVDKKGHSWPAHGDQGILANHCHVPAVTPSLEPTTPEPTVEPTTEPTVEPTTSPTDEPTVTPSPDPTPTQEVVLPPEPTSSPAPAPSDPVVTVVSAADDAPLLAETGVRAWPIVLIAVVLILAGVAARRLARNH